MAYGIFGGLSEPKFAIDLIWVGGSGATESWKSSHRTSGKNRIRRRTDFRFPNACGGGQPIISAPWPCIGLGWRHQICLVVKSRCFVFPVGLFGPTTKYRLPSLQLGLADRDSRGGGKPPNVVMIPHWSKLEKMLW